MAHFIQLAPDDIKTETLATHALHWAPDLWAVSWSLPSTTTSSKLWAMSFFLSCRPDLEKADYQRITPLCIAPKVQYTHGEGRPTASTTTT